MKKVITILSLIALISTVLFTVFSIFMGYSMMDKLSITPENPAEVNRLVGFKTASLIFCAVLDVLISLYLLIGTKKTPSILPEIVIAAARFVVLPIFSLADSFAFQKSVIRLTGIDVTFINVFNAGIGNIFTIFNQSDVLLMFAIAFTIAVKVLVKPENKEKPLLS